MDTARDLARGDPWRESLERSLARRRASRRPRAVADAPIPSVSVPTEAPIGSESVTPPARTTRDRTRRTRSTHTRTPRTPSALPANLRKWRERAVAALALMPSLGPRSVGALALVAAIVASSLAGGGSQAAPTAARAAAARITFAAPRAPITPTAASGTCPLTVATAGYVNPLLGATVKPERIDQGVDYAGSGTLVAIGRGKVTYVGTSNTGWPGAFIEYQLLSGADAGCYVFYAEGVVPADGLAAGQTVAAGQPLATIIPNYPTGIEVGWGGGRGTKAYAKVAGQWSPTDDQNNVASAAGKSFSALIAALGGPPGKVEG